MSAGRIELVLESFVSMCVAKGLNERSLGNALSMRKIIGVLLHLRQKNVFSTSLPVASHVGSLYNKAEGISSFPSTSYYSRARRQRPVKPAKSP